MPRSYRAEISRIFADSIDPSGVHIAMPEEMWHGWNLVASPDMVPRFSKAISIDAHRKKFETHPDMAVIADWLEGRGEPAKEACTIFWGSYFALCEWEDLPKLNGKQHVKLHRKVATLCEKLKLALGETNRCAMLGRGIGLQGLVLNYLTDIEKSAIAAEMRNPDTIEMWDFDNAGPTIDDLLTRIAGEATRLELKGPIHAQPKKRGAERGYFVRRMGEFFTKQYMATPTEIIAALTTISLDQATDRELVTAALKRA